MTDKKRNTLPEASDWKPADWRKKRKRKYRVVISKRKVGMSAYAEELQRLYYRDFGNIAKKKREVK